MWSSRSNMYFINIIFNDIRIWVISDPSNDPIYQNVTINFNQIAALMDLNSKFLLKLFKSDNIGL